MSQEWPSSKSLQSHAEQLNNGAVTNPVGFNLTNNWIDRKDLKNDIAGHKNFDGYEKYQGQNY